MFSSFLITFRETLEAVLVIGIVLAFLSETNQVIFKKFVWWGICAGLLISISLSFMLQVLFGGFEGKTEEIFEGTLMFLTAGFITWMILWIHNQKDIAVKIKKKIAFHAEKGYGVGILILIATAISREGTETVLYLKASSAIGQSNQLTGALLGIICSLLLGYIFLNGPCIQNFIWFLKLQVYISCFLQPALFQVAYMNSRKQAYCQLSFLIL